MPKETLGDARIHTIRGPAAASARRQWLIIATVAALLAVVLAVDVSVGLWAQRTLGMTTWLVLVALLRGEDGQTRVQVGIVVAIATAVEYTASPWLGFYTYRLHNVPAFVPPGHGLIYLAALALSRTTSFRTHTCALARVVFAVAAAWAVRGVALADRSDALGMLTFLLLARFLMVGRAPGVYAAAFVVTSVLELYGTSLGNWAWATHDPTGIVSIGNPPSGISGAYCIFDAAALAGGATILGWLDRRSARPAVPNAPIALAAGEA